MDKAQKASLEICGATKTQELPGCSGGKDLLSVPPHIQSSGSLLHVDLFSEGSDSEYDTKSRSSGLEMDLLDSPNVMDLNGRSLDRVAAVSVKGDEPDSREEELDYPILCGGNIKDYINDLTILSHAALIGKDHSINKIFDKEPPKSESPSLSDANVCMSTYEKWKRLSGPMALFVVIGLIFLVWGRGHFFQLLEWLEKLPLCYSLVVFITLFTIVSFPFGFGYIVLNMMAGYLYGFFRGQLIVMLSVSVGISVSFMLCRLWFKDYARSVVTSNALQAVLKVLEGPQGFKVIFLTRFTPIPFGFQNVLFSVSSPKIKIKIVVFVSCISR